MHCIRIRGHGYYEYVVAKGAELSVGGEKAVGPSLHPRSILVLLSRSPVADSIQPH